MRSVVGVGAAAIILAAVATFGVVPSGAAWPKCGPRLTFLVWPHGHPALASIRFPSLPNPHVEAYIDFGNQWPDARAGGYIIGGKPPAAFPTGGSLGPCLNYGASLSSGTVTGGVTYANQTAVRCSFPSAGVIDIVDLPGKRQVMLVHAGKTVLARADASPTAASVTVPAKLCKKVSAPGNPPTG